MPCFGAGTAASGVKDLLQKRSPTPGRDTGRRERRFCRLRHPVPGRRRAWRGCGNSAGRFCAPERPRTQGAKFIRSLFDNQSNGLYDWGGQRHDRAPGSRGQNGCPSRGWRAQGHGRPAFAAVTGMAPNCADLVNIGSTAGASAQALRNADVVFELLAGYPGFESAVPEGGFSRCLLERYKMLEGK